MVISAGALGQQDCPKWLHSYDWQMSGNVAGDIGQGPSFSSMWAFPNGCLGFLHAWHLGSKEFQQDMTLLNSRTNTPRRKEQTGKNI